MPDLDSFTHVVVPWRGSGLSLEFLVYERRERQLHSQFRFPEFGGVASPKTVSAVITKYFMPAGATAEISASKLQRVICERRVSSAGRLLFHLCKEPRIELRTQALVLSGHFVAEIPQWLPACFLQKKRESSSQPPDLIDPHRLGLDWLLRYHHFT